MPNDEETESQVYYRNTNLQRLEKNDDIVCERTSATIMSTEMSMVNELVEMLVGARPLDGTVGLSTYNAYAEKQGHLRSAALERVLSQIHDIGGRLDSLRFRGATKHNLLLITEVNALLLSFLQDVEERWLSAATPLTMLSLWLQLQSDSDLQILLQLASYTLSSFDNFLTLYDILANRINTESSSVMVSACQKHLQSMLLEETCSYICGTNLSYSFRLPASLCESSSTLKRIRSILQEAVTFKDHAKTLETIRTLTFNHKLCLTTSETWRNYVSACNAACGDLQRSIGCAMASLVSVPLSVLRVVAPYQREAWLSRSKQNLEFRWPYQSSDRAIVRVILVPSLPSTLSLSFPQSVYDPNNNLCQRLTEITQYLLELQNILAGLICTYEYCIGNGRFIPSLWQLTELFKLLNSHSQSQLGCAVLTLRNSDSHADREPTSVLEIQDSILLPLEYALLRSTSHRLYKDTIDEIMFLTLDYVSSALDDQKFTPDDLGKQAKEIFHRVGFLARSLQLDPVQAVLSAQLSCLV